MAQQVHVAAEHFPTLVTGDNLHLGDAVAGLAHAVRDYFVESAAFKVTHGELAALSVLKMRAGKREGGMAAGAPKEL